ncbi:unnamed protein product, partial [Scytosiphon promiscuus]
TACSKILLRPDAGGIQKERSLRVNVWAIRADVTAFVERSTNTHDRGQALWRGRP